LAFAIDCAAQQSVESRYVESRYYVVTGKSQGRGARFDVGAS
jgi:hypothetical protein